MALRLGTTVDCIAILHVLSILNSAANETTLSTSRPLLVASLRFSVVLSILKAFRRRWLSQDLAGLWPFLEPLNAVIPQVQQIGNAVGRQVSIEVVKFDQHGRLASADGFAAAHENIVFSSFHINLKKIR